MKTTHRIVNWTLVLFCLGVWISGGEAIAKPDQDLKVRAGYWLVELDSPPTLLYEGPDPVAIQARAGVMPRAKASGLAATAPTITGRRLNVMEADVQAYVSQLEQEQGAVLQAMGERLGRSIRPERAYHHTFNGFLVQMSEQERRALGDIPGIRAVKPDVLYQRHTDRGPGLIGAKTLWSVYPEASFAPSRGEGVVVGIIDSGINWDHRMFQDAPPGTLHTFINPYGEYLGECSKAQVSCNDKLVGVYDFTTEGTFGKDPEGDGHGTHVASTAAGNVWSNLQLQSTGDYVFNISGVAPNANIISYKVCYQDHPTDDELDETCVSSAIQSALEQAVIDAVDVVNYSIGGGAGNPWQSAAAFRPLWANDIAFVTSAGNSGPAASTIGNPANAPWVMTVGNSTHDRLVASVATVGSVDDIATVPGGGGPEITADITATARRVDAVSPNNILACDPLPAGSLSGQIAVIVRGICTFETKITHAQQAGAIAVLMSNNVGGLPITMGGIDGTLIPSVMMGKADGDEALALLANGPQQATLFAGTEVTVNSDFADNMNSSSSRGPAPFVDGLMKPNVVAPGTNILGAYVPNENSIGFLSGTSMASPHVAGAAALLRAIHPTWSVDAVFSALQTTADIRFVRSAGEPATVHDRGAGRVNVALASRVGLYLPLKNSEFDAFDPDQGGDPSAINLPGLVNESCGSVCTFTRTVRALRDGDWTVSIDGDSDITVSPDAFSLDENQTQVLTITVRPDPAQAGDLEESRVLLQEKAPPTYLTNVTQPVKQYLTVAVANNKSQIPSLIEITTASSKGQTQIPITSLRGLSRAQFVTSGLDEMVETTFSLLEDMNNDSPYDGNSGVKTFVVPVGPQGMGLYVETTESDAPDMDLYVGFDSNGDGLPQESEEICRSVSSNALERCWIQNPLEGDWWIVVQNWMASGTAVSDSVTLRYGAAVATDQPVLSVHGPGIHVGGPITLDLYYDDPSFGVDDLRLGVLSIRNGTREDTTTIASIPIIMSRNFVSRSKTTVLFPNESLMVSLPENSVHEKLYIDVPPSTSRLEIDVEGDAGVSARLARVDFDDIPAHAPDTPPVPSTSITTGSGSSSGFTMSVSDPEAGRYYVVLDNSLGPDRQVTVTSRLTETGRIETRYALYSPVGREINQGLEFQDAGQPFAVWYSFDDDGLPIFYLGSAPQNEASSVWVARLDRYTRGLDQQLATPAGQMALTTIDRQTAVFSWRLNGAHGSDLMSAAIIPETCVSEGGAKKSYTGHWYSPGQDQGGSTTIMAPGIQIQVRYYYDALGIGRWVQLAAPGAGPEATTLNVIGYRGFCPNCDPITPTSQVIGNGTYSRVYASESSGEEALTFLSGSPLNQAFSTGGDIPIQKLSAPLPCP